MRNKITRKATGVVEWIDHLAKRLESQKRFATARNYVRAGRSFSRFLGGRSLPLAELTAGQMRAYNYYLASRGDSRNTISFYNRILRAAWHQADEAGFKLARYPFSQVFTGIDNTRKRALDAASLRRIAQLDLSGNPVMALSRDLFLFSFYARGMSFVDLAYLERSAVRGGAILYVRRKTRTPVSVFIEPCMQEIMDRWSGSAAHGRVFPLLASSGDSRAIFRQYTYKLDRHNRLLKEIGRRAGVCGMNSYMARHSWATLARDLSVPLPLISASLGHTSERTTRIYLSAIDRSVLDEANRRLITAVFSPEDRGKNGNKKVGLFGRDRL